MDLTHSMVCPKCGIVISKRSYHKHISRERCKAQHIRGK